MTHPNERLRLAREKAGFKTATDAAKRFSWSVTTYRAHENGQNGLKNENAERYARAFRA